MPALPGQLRALLGQLRALLLRSAGHTPDLLAHPQRRSPKVLPVRQVNHEKAPPEVVAASEVAAVVASDADQGVTAARVVDSKLVPAR